MYKTILVPLDGSKRAEAILPHVKDMAAHYGSSIVFLRVFEISLITPEMAEFDDEYKALPHLSRERLQEMVADAQNYLRGITKQMANHGIRSRFCVEHGPVAATIINTARREKADIIAMASHGASGLEGVYYGSVAAGVLQRVDRPLLIVRSYEVDE
ncbi:MAG: universal stress protein [Candidatus Promineifilaceae bacterium]|jgi:nucleotide-binding universal stress UspA family protein